jgi:hypothetical protein
MQGSDFPQNIVGKRFRTDDGKTFTVLEGECFLQRAVARQHRRYLSDLREGLLVSVSFYGQPVPLITLDDGVVRLVEVECGEETLKTSLVISKALGLVTTRQPKRLSPV